MIYQGYHVTTEDGLAITYRMPNTVRTKPLPDENCMDVRIVLRHRYRNYRYSSTEPPTEIKSDIKYKSVLVPLGLPLELIESFQKHCQFEAKRLSRKECKIRIEPIFLVREKGHGRFCVTWELESNTFIGYGERQCDVIRRVLKEPANRREEIY